MSNGITEGRQLTGKPAQLAVFVSSIATSRPTCGESIRLSSVAREIEPATARLTSAALLADET